MPWSNTSIDGCSLSNTWPYDQILITRTGLGIVLAPGAQTPIQTPVVQRQRDADDVYGH